MKENQIHLINKLFNNKTIRTVWNREEEKYYVSVVDIIASLTDSIDSNGYWRKLKQRLKQEGNETVTNCHGLKLKARDGKYRMTDVVDIEGMFRLIESIPSKNAEPMKLWLARLGKMRIDEVFDPSITVQRAIDTYRAKGYDEEWIITRIKGIQDRNKLTDTWKNSGVTKEIEFSILTDEIYKEWSGMTTKEYKNYKGLRKESLRDNMSELEVALADIGELTTRKLAEKHKPKGLKENKKIAKAGGQVANNTRKDIEEKLGEPIITQDNLLDYQYIEDLIEIGK